ncbi:MAG: hypothetical protein Q9162_005082 [Coniocarpon cinnabarinum]
MSAVSATSKRMRAAIQAIVAAWFVSQVCAQGNVTDVLSYVDQLIGTDNGGNVFAGATLRMTAL